MNIQKIYDAYADLGSRLIEAFHTAPTAKDAAAVADTMVWLSRRWNSQHEARYDREVRNA
jgi:hypothetical protein